MDLSSPHGSLINDFVTKDDYTLHYASFDEALTLVPLYGQKALLAKLDIKDAFLLYPVRLEDHKLLGIHWQGKFYVDLHLPFGLRSFPYLFNRIADTFDWLLKSNYHIQDLMHYLDDYFTVSSANSSVCAHNIKTILHVASRVGIPLAPNKLDGPTTRLVFLGILIDTDCMETSLPDDKLHELISELQSWSTRKKCLKQELLSLIGKLNFACWIIPAGCIFLRHPIDLSTSARLPHHYVTMNREARHDIAWWLRFFPLGMAGPLYLTPIGPNHQIWSSSRIPLADLAMASFTWATGLPSPGPLNSKTDQFSGKSSTPLPLHAFSGISSGRERSSSFPATTKQ